MPCVDGGTSLAQHWHQRGLSVPRCLEQSTVMLVPLRAPVWPIIGTSGALMRADASTSIGSCLVILGGTWLVQHPHQWGLGSPRCLEQSRHMLVLLGHLSRTPSRPTRLCCARMPGPALAHALCCWGHLAGTTFVPTGPWCAKVPRAV